MPYCRTMKLPDGTVAHLRFAGKAPARCPCGKEGTRMCDWMISRGRTCDAPLCDACTSSPAPEKDLCKRHAEQWAADPRNNRGEPT